MNRLIKCNETRGVTLANHHEMQSTRQVRSIFQFGKLGRMLISHGMRGVQNYVVTKVSFLFVLLDVVPVGLPVNFPVHMPKFITRVVGSVLSKFDRKPVIWAFMHAGYESFHDQSRPELHIGDLSDKIGIQVFQGLRFGAHRPACIDRSAGIRRI